MVNLTDMSNFNDTRPCQGEGRKRRAVPGHCAVISRLSCLHSVNCEYTNSTDVDRQIVYQRIGTTAILCFTNLGYFAPKSYYFSQVDEQFYMCRAFISVHQINPFLKILRILILAEIYLQWTQSLDGYTYVQETILIICTLKLSPNCRNRQVPSPLIPYH